MKTLAIPEEWRRGGVGRVSGATSVQQVRRAALLKERTRQQVENLVSVFSVKELLS